MCSILINLEKQLTTSTLILLPLTEYLLDMLIPIVRQLIQTNEAVHLLSIQLEVAPIELLAQSFLIDDLCKPAKRAIVQLLVIPDYYL